MPHCVSGPQVQAAGSCQNIMLLSNQRARQPTDERWLTAASCTHGYMILVDFIFILTYDELRSRPAQACTLPA